VSLGDGRRIELEPIRRQEASEPTVARLSRTTRRRLRVAGAARRFTPARLSRLSVLGHQADDAVVAVEPDRGPVA
jgi:hypothetical protein